MEKFSYDSIKAGLTQKLRKICQSSEEAVFRVAREHGTSEGFPTLHRCQL